MRSLGLFVAAAVAAASLSGCSMIPGMGSQSGVQACAAVSGTLQSAATTLSTALSNASTDPAAAAAAVDKFSAELAGARGKVTNKDVGAAMDKMTSAVGEMSTLLKKAGSDPSSIDSEKLNSILTQVQQASTEFTTACTKA